MNVYTIDMKKEVPSKKTKNANELQKPAAIKKTVAVKKVVRTKAPKVMTINDWLHEPVILIPLVFVLLFVTLALWTSILPMQKPLNTKNHAGFMVQDAVYAKSSGFFNRSRQYNIVIKYPRFEQSGPAFSTVRNYMMNDIADMVQQGMKSSNAATRVTIQGGYTISSSYSSVFGEVLSVVLTVNNRAYNSLTGALVSDGTATRSYNIKLATNEMIWLDDVSKLNPSSIKTLVKNNLVAVGSQNVSNAVSYLDMIMSAGYGKALPFAIQGENVLIYIDSSLGGYAIKPVVITIPLDKAIELPTVEEETPAEATEAPEASATTPKTAQ